MTPEYAVRPTPAPIESQEVHEFEAKVSQAQARQMESEGKTRTVRAGERLWGFDIPGIVQRLVPVTQRPNLFYVARLTQNKDPNAAALADGRIYVTSGMLNYLAERGSREDELAFVLAHELAHTNAQHLLQRYEYLQQQSLVAGLIDVGLAAATRGATGTASQIGSLARDAVSLVQDVNASGYSQQQELEADQLGMRYLLKAGYNPEAALAMVEDFARFDQPAIPFLRTHPVTELRADYLRRYLRDLEGWKASAGDELQRLRDAQKLYPAGSTSWKNLQQQIDSFDRR